MSQESGGPGRETLADWILAWLVENVGLDPDSTSLDRTFINQGVDSMHAMMMVGDLEEHLSRTLSPTLAWDHPTPEALAAFLAADEAPSGASDGDGEVAEIVDRLDEMSEEDLDALLEKHVYTEESG